MIFEEKKVVLKNGAEAILKTPEIEDAEMLLNSIKTSCTETEFLSRTIEDWEGVTTESEEKFIHNVRESKNTLFIACYMDGIIAGNCDITFNTGCKTSHRATVGIAIQKKYWNIGIGSAMFRELIKAAKERNGTSPEIAALFSAFSTNVKTALSIFSAGRSSLERIYFKRRFSSKQKHKYNADSP